MKVSRGPSPELAVRTVGGLAVLWALTAAGCGGLDLVPVAGTVTLDGQPVPDAAVMFQPVGGGPVAAGTTDAAGRFSLETLNRSGVAPGKYRVGISKYTLHGITEEGMPGPAGVRTEHHVPPKYAVPETSGLTAEVSAQQRQFLFALSTQRAGPNLKSS